MQVVTTYDTAGVSARAETPTQAHGSEGVSYAFKPLNIDQSRRFDSDAADVVAFLAFITDPTAGKRVQIGVWALIFLAIFTVIAWRLNAVYWKKIR